jgi:Tfp pilus assembly protein PilX
VEAVDPDWRKHAPQPEVLLLTLLTLLILLTLLTLCY